MFDTDRGSADITLCIFPHLREFIAIDARKNRSGGPAVLSLSISNILGEEFYTGVERDFSKLLRRHDIGFLELMGIPQQVEAVVRANLLKRIIAELGILPAEDSKNPGGTVGVLFFAGTLLSFEVGQLREATRELFGKKLSPVTLEQLNDQLINLMEKEQKTVSDTSQQDLAGLISGKSGPYVTLWESRGK
ncbi:MAG TPA: hypothetical protein EYQ61_02930 [Dehalococcoidia bacterium]|jgi:hypothetical protein|nr:hypothetical protein [Dehalococcoidia bacterium]HIK88700.1 hypothetical protein [Dehalococcoidia bacterium]